MKKILIILFITCPFTLFSQINISGIVLDKETGFYYFNELKRIGSFNVKTADSDYKVDFQTFTSIVDKYPSNQINAKKKVGFLFQLFDRKLFEIDFPNSPGFWKQYVK